MVNGETNHNYRNNSTVKVKTLLLDNITKHSIMNQLLLQTSKINGRQLTNHNNHTSKSNSYVKPEILMVNNMINNSFNKSQILMGDNIAKHNNGNHSLSL